MQSSHVDRVNLRTWTLSIVCAVLSLINVIVFSVAAHFPGIGFPCYYPRLVDLDGRDANLTDYNVLHHLTPRLYLDDAQLVIYVIVTEALFAGLVAYYLLCWVKIFFRRSGGADGGGGKQLNQSSRDIAFLGDTTSCFAFVLTVDTFQVYLLSLAFRLPSMVAFANGLYFICLTALVITSVTRYESRERNAFALSKIHPRLRGTVLGCRTAAINAAEFVLGLATMTLALSLAAGFGDSLYVNAPTVMYGALAAFGTLSLIYFSVIEGVLIHYLRPQFGYHLGTLCATCGTAYPVVRYAKLNSPEQVTNAAIVLGTLTALCLVFLATRTIRFLLRRARRYRALPAETDEIRSLTSSSTSTGYGGSED